MEEITRERIFKIRRNLTDAGCEAAFIEEFLELEKEKAQGTVLSAFPAQSLPIRGTASESV